MEKKNILPKYNEIILWIVDRKKKVEQEVVELSEITSKLELSGVATTCRGAEWGSMLAEVICSPYVPAVVGRVREM